MFRTLAVDPNSVGSLSPEASLSGETNTEVTESPHSFLPPSLSSPPSSLPPPRRLGKWILCETLGLGGFSKVKLAIDPDSGQRYAMKVNTECSHLSAKYERALRRELGLIQTIVHENVIRLHSWEKDAEYPNTDGTSSPCVFSVLEFAAGGELFDFLKFVGRFDEITSRTYFHQLVAGMKACHEAGVAHRDIKPENLLLDERYVLKIADFGFAEDYRRGDVEYLMKTARGKRGYLSPEILRGESYSHKNDVFSCGIILFTLFAGFPPFQVALSTDWWWNKLEVKNYRLFWMAHERSRKFSDEMKNMIVQLLASNPDERYDFGQIERDAWFNGDTFTHEQLYHHLEEVRADANRKRAIQARQHLENARTRPDPIGVYRRPAQSHPDMERRYQRKTDELGRAERFELETDDWKDASFQGMYHQFISKQDVRQTVARVAWFCDERGFAYELGGQCRILMIRAGWGDWSGMTENVLFAMKVFRLSVEGRFRVVFKRFSGDPKRFSDVVDDMLGAEEIEDLMDFDMMLADKRD